MTSGTVITMRALSRNPSFWVHIIHIFAVGPLLVYAGIYLLSKKTVSRFLAILLLIMGLGTVGTHVWGLAKQIQAHQ